MAGRNPPENSPIANPYLAARNEWNERYGSYVKAVAAWRIVGVTGIVMAVIGFTYALYQSTQVKLVPYIVEVDKLGTASNAGFPQQIEYA
ncbi:MAG: conjugal transfer protein TrbF, partial [Stutzerimonas stutzeri]